MKKSAKKTRAEKENLPELVTVMARLVERLESMEKKMDQVVGRVSSLPGEMRQAVQNAVHPAPVPPPSPNHSPRERVLHKAVCADCLKICEVPFQPKADRPVYCPACWAIRKAGHAPKDIASNIVIPAHVRELKTPLPPAPKGKKTAAGKGKNITPRASKKKSKKKK